MVFITIYPDARLCQVNLPYILWGATFNTSFLLAYLVVLDMSFFPGPKPKKKKKKSFESITISGPRDRTLLYLESHPWMRWLWKVIRLSSLTR